MDKRTSENKERYPGDSQPEEREQRENEKNLEREGGIDRTQRTSVVQKKGLMRKLWEHQKLLFQLLPLFFQSTYF